MEISGFPEEMQEHIRKGEVALGMPPVAVRCSWGPPAHINVMQPDGQGNEREMWIYTKLRLITTKLVFKDGKLSSIISGMVQMKPEFKKEKVSEEDAGSEAEAPETPEEQ
jgi:hypothetical protein